MSISYEADRFWGSQESTEENQIPIKWLARLKRSGDSYFAGPTSKQKDPWTRNDERTEPGR
jgi:hypothetical protein